eukprot:655942-Amorphochlora_amoeboformis.AAC.1
MQYAGDKIRPRDEISQKSRCKVNIHRGDECKLSRRINNCTLFEKTKTQSAIITTGVSVFANPMVTGSSPLTFRCTISALLSVPCRKHSATNFEAASKDSRIATHASDPRSATKASRVTFTTSPEPRTNNFGSL